MAGRRGASAEVYKCPCWRYTQRVYRGKGKKRKRNHMKVLYCPICKQYRNFMKVSF